MGRLKHSRILFGESQQDTLAQSTATAHDYRTRRDTGGVEHEQHVMARRQDVAIGQCLEVHVGIRAISDLKLDQALVNIETVSGRTASYQDRVRDVGRV